MPTTTTYLINYTASLNESFRQSMAVAMANLARNIQSEDPSSLSLPAGYNKGVDEAAKKQNLHEERVELASLVLSNPTGISVRYGISLAETMDIYEAGGNIFLALTDSAPSNTDYSNNCSALWNAWEVTAKALTV